MVLNETVPTNSTFNAGASSTQLITSAGGYLEFTTAEKTTAKVCGLGNGDANQTASEPDFAFDLTPAGKIRVREGAALKINPVTRTVVWGTYVANDVFRVAVESGVVKLYKNAVLLYTSTAAPVFPLRADTSFLTLRGTINNSRIQRLP